MSKRIALQNNIYKTNQSFCIYKQLKKKGFIAGKYHVDILKQKDAKLIIKETSVPKIVEELKNEEQNFQAIYDDEQDLKELLSLSNDNQKFININSWEEVLPLYTTSPVS